MDMDDILEGLLTIGILLLGVVFVLAELLLIGVCAWIIEWVFDSLSINIDRTIYWTLVAVLMLFCMFGKTKIENKKTVIKKGDFE